MMDALKAMPPLLNTLTREGPFTKGEQQGLIYRRVDPP